MRKLFWVACSVCLIVSALHAQTGLGEEEQVPFFALKTNALYWATTTLNLGVEFRLAPKWSLMAEVGLNPFTGSLLSICGFIRRRVIGSARRSTVISLACTFLTLYIMCPISTGWAPRTSVIKVGALA